jgi:type VI secretion system protein ImpK
MCRCFQPVFRPTGIYPKPERNVVDVLSGNLQLSVPLVAEGRADSQPLVPNDTAAHKAMNRRVEIIF